MTTDYLRSPALPYLAGNEPCVTCGCRRSDHLPDGPPTYGNGAPTPGDVPYYRAHCDRCLKHGQPTNPHPFLP